MTHQEEIAVLLEQAREAEATIRELERRLVQFSDRHNLTLAVLRRLYPYLLALHQNARDIPKEFTAAIEAARDVFSLAARGREGPPAPTPSAPALTLLPKANHEG